MADVVLQNEEIWMASANLLGKRPRLGELDCGDGDSSKEFLFTMRRYSLRDFDKSGPYEATLWLGSASRNAGDRAEHCGERNMAGNLVGGGGGAASCQLGLQLN